MDSGVVNQETIPKVAVNQKLREVAERILKSSFGLRLRRVGADSRYEPRLCLHTFPYAAQTSSLDLDPNWTELFIDRWPTHEEWQEELLPALHNVKDVLSSTIASRTLYMIVQARLPTAFILGFNFPMTAHLILVLEGRYGVWRTTTAVASDPLAVMLGHQFNALRAITLYQYMEAQGQYKPVCTLGSSSD